MKNLILTLLTAGFFSVSYAQDTALLYEVSGKDLAQPSYIYGTFHLLCATDLQLTDSTQKAMTSAEQLYLEFDFDDPALQSKMIKAMLLSDGKNLKDFLKSDDYAALDTYMQENLGKGLAQVGVLKPIALFSVVYVGILKCQPASFDLTFAQLAGESKKEVLGLETIEEQMAVFDKIPLDKQLEGLVDIVRKPDEVRKELTNLLAAYKAQDLVQLMKLIRDSQFDAGSVGFEEELLDKRNSSWIPVIEKAAQEKSTFFAFGAGHLGGANGVVNLLRQKGYTVKALQ